MTQSARLYVSPEKFSRPLIIRGQTKIDGHSIVDVRTEIGLIVDQYCRMPIKGKNGTGRGEYQEGGYICVVRSQRPEIIMPEDPVGVFPLVNMEKYRKFSLEKAVRLYNHPDHFASAQSRDPQNDQYGGAIRAGYIIASFSGLPEEGDSAVMLVLSVINNWLDLQCAEDFADKIGNRFFRPLYERVIKAK